MNSIRLAELNKLEEYLDGRISPSSIRLYVQLLSRWFYSLDGSEPTRDLAQSYVDGVAKTKSPATANLHACAIMKYFKWRGTPIRLDCPSIPPPEPKYLNKDQVLRVISSCRTLLERVLVVVLFDTAVRISELLNLRTADIDWQEGFITVVRKGGRTDMVSISPRAVSVLKQWVESRDVRSGSHDGDLVFMGLTYQDAWRILKAVGKRVGVVLHPHMLRHSRAAQLLLDGTEINVVKDHLGHVNIATTINIYGKLKAADVKRKLKPW